MTPTTMLFVPADRPELFGKAAATLADVIVLDFEDAVAPDRKREARLNLRGCALDPKRVYVRVNGFGTEEYASDLSAVIDTAFRNIVLPKSESVSDLEQLVVSLGGNASVVPLIETAAGLDNSRNLAMHHAVPFLAFGSLDFALDLGCSHTPEALSYARHQLVFQSRMSGKPRPVDGISAAIDDMNEVRADALRSKELGFSGKLVIHPKHVELVRNIFRPSEAEIAWARSILQAVGGATGGAVKVAGRMVDRPIVLRAEEILAQVGSSD